MSMTDAEIREALARAERATCSCHIEITRVHGFPQSHRSDCARTDVPRLAADLLAARAERDDYRTKWCKAVGVANQIAARCRELEAERAIVADYLRDTDADFRARRPSERAVLGALLSPPPSHTCQIHRATSGASDCGLSPCEEAKVHRDRGASRPATVRRVQPTPSPEATETWRDAIGCAPSPPGSISSEEAIRRVRDGETTPFEADTMTHEDGGVA